MKNKRGRDAITGRFITLEEARRRPSETMVVTIRKRCRKPLLPADPK